MAYTPVNWQTGETISAARLNKMDNGWGISVGTRTTICEETIQTVGEGTAFGEFTYSTEIEEPSIIVTLNGVEYECQYNTDILGYGDINFVNYPFVIDYYEGVNEIVTPQAGTYSVKIESVTPSTVEVSQDFASAVAFHAEVGKTTFQEIDDAIALGRIVIITHSDEYGSGIQYVTSTDKTSSPLSVRALNSSDGTVNAQTYLASSANSPIESY